MSLHELIVTDDVKTALQSYVQTQGYQQAIVLCDTNTEQFCLPHLNLGFPVLTMPAGEQHKTLKVAEQIIEQLMQLQCGKQTVLINLGGGVVSDLGGFVASVFKRGIPFINVPTTLLGMVDAAIGGKTGLDHAFAKNIIGSIYQPKAVFVDVRFLNTMPAIETLSTFAEVFKIAIVANAGLYKQLIDHPWPSAQTGALQSLIQQSIQSKLQLVEQDPHDQSVRQLLNFGHTYGHAYEAFLWQSGRPISHGQAVLWGMKKEIALAVHLGVLPLEEASHIMRGFELYQFERPQVEPEFMQLLPFLLMDKKNSEQYIGFSLPTKIGVGQIQFKVKTEQLKNCYALPII